MEQRNLILDCIGSEDLVWGTQLTSAIRRATTELSHRRLARREQQDVGSKRRFGRYKGQRGKCDSPRRLSSKVDKYYLLAGAQVYAGGGHRSER